MDAVRFPVTVAYCGMRLDRFLQQMLPRMSRAAIQRAIVERVRLLSGLPAKAARRLVVGEEVMLQPPPAPAVRELAIPVVATGAGWLAVDKPAGIACTPGSTRPGDDLASRLQAAPAHRLDRFTSGCLLLTRERGVAAAFDRAFRAHRIHKQYVAMVEGVVADDRIAIAAPLGLAVRSRVTGKVAVAPDGLAASTEVEVLWRGPARSLVRVLPRTGRRHQIRVHLAHIGHPIVGDLLYGHDERQFIRFQRGQPLATPPGLAPGRHLLHAERLVFPDPVTGRCVEARVAWPADFGLEPESVVASRGRAGAQVSAPGVIGDCRHSPRQ